jgi:hypothetical protein
MVFRKYEKTFRILHPKINVKGKHFLSSKEVKALLGGNVVILEKLDAANSGIIRNKNDFRLQKRGSLVGASEHAQFNHLKAWSYENYDKLMTIPKNTILYGEWMSCVHTIFYDALPDWFIPFAWYNKQSKEYYHYDKMVELCNKIGLTPAPEIARGHFTKDELFDLIPEKSAFGNEKSEGLVVWNYKRQMRGKLVREEFVKNMNDDVHWSKKSLRKNKLKDK